MQNRKVFTDEWTMMEKACLVSAVHRFGEDWNAVCDFLKPRLQDERQNDWFSAETFEAQYRQLTKHSTELITNCENPLTRVIQYVKSKCKIDPRVIDDQHKKYLSLKKIVERLVSGEILDEELDKYEEHVLKLKKERDESLRKDHQELIRKRELQKVELEKSITIKSPNKHESKNESTSPLTTSPLLSSLLNNPPAVQYRPTLSTSSFVPTKSPSRGSSNDCTASTSLDTSVKDSSNQEFSDLASSYSNSSSSVARKLDFEEASSSSSSPRSVRITSVKEKNKEMSGLNTSEKIESPNTNNVVMVSPNEETYLSEVDIPPETLLEVMDNINEGTLDKLIRDFETNEENVTLSKEELANIRASLSQSYSIAKEMQDEKTMASESINDTVIDANSVEPSIADVSSEINIATVTMSNEGVEIASEIDETSVKREMEESKTEVVPDKALATEKETEKIENELVDVKYEVEKSEMNVIRLESDDEHVEGSTSTAASLDGYVTCESTPEVTESETVPIVGKEAEEMTIICKSEEQEDENVSDYVGTSVKEPKEESQPEVFERPTVEEVNEASNDCPSNTSDDMPLSTKRDQIQAEKSKVEDALKEQPPTVEHEKLIDKSKISADEKKQTSSDTSTVEDVTMRRLLRKRRNTSDLHEIANKLPKIEPNETSIEQSKLASREKNVPIEDSRDGGLEPETEKELPKSVEEQSVEDESISKNSSTPVKTKAKKSKDVVDPAEAKKNPKTRKSSVSKPASKNDLKSSAEDSEQAKTRKKSISLAYSRLMAHKYSNAFQKPITNKQVPGYEDVVYFPMDLHTIKKKIDNKQLNSLAEFQRDVLIMLNNAKMFNQTNSQVFNMAVEVEKDTLDDFEVMVQALNEGVMRKREGSGDKIRKRPSLDTSRKEQRPAKRTKTSMTKEDTLLTRSIKVEDDSGTESLHS